MHSGINEADFLWIWVLSDSVIYEGASSGGFLS